MTTPPNKPHRMKLPGAPLTTSDLEALKPCFIDRKMAERALLRRVNSVDGAEIIGRTKADYSGIIFPYIWPGESNVRDIRLRRDRPDIEIKADGTRKETAKYLGPPGRGAKLYFLPGADPRDLENTNL